MTLSSGLKIRENTIIRRQRLLILPGKVMADIGQKVQPDTILAKTELPSGMPVAVDLASFFGIAPNQVPATMRKNVGDHLQVGDTLAVLRNCPREGGRKIYVSPYRGLIEHVSHSHGLVLIREGSNADEPMVEVDVAEAPYEDAALVKAFLFGRVVEVIPERGAVVEATGTQIEGVFGVGREQFGALVQVTKRQNEEIDACHINEEHAGMVVFGGAGINLAGMVAALDNKVAGVIVGGLRSTDLVALLGKEISTGITGQENIITTFIATEGFGNVPMLDYTFKTLQKSLGQTASINGRTQIRAGAQRPEVFISHPLAELVAEQNESSRAARLDAGALVRVIVDPYLGQAGEVIAMLPSTLLPTEAEMPLLQVKLQDGRVVELLANNVERMKN